MSRAIPPGITHEHVLRAVVDFEAGVPHTFKQSTKYDLIVNGCRYPPKAILALAAKYVCGRVLESHEFSGGLSSKCFKVLESAGFEMVVKEAVQLPTFDTFVELFDRQVRPLGEIKRLHGRDKGGSWEIFGRFWHDSVLWNLYSDSEILPLYRGRHYAGDPFEIEVNSKGTQCLRLRREFRDSDAAQVYIYAVDQPRVMPDD